MLVVVLSVVHCFIWRV